MADFGSVSLVAFASVAVGSIALAMLFAWLGRRISAAGGPYVYARLAFGDFAGFLSAWSYWVTTWAGTPPSPWPRSPTSTSS